MAIGSFISWSCMYRIPVYWCGTRAFAERVTVRFLAAYVKHICQPTTTTTNLTCANGSAN